MSTTAANSLLDSVTPDETPDGDTVITWIARAGYAAKGVVYILIGYFSLKLALGSGRDGEAAGPKEALENLTASPFSTVLLVAMAVGLVSYAVWRWLQAGLDPENKGNDLKGIVTRIGYACSGVMYASFALEAALLVVGASNGDYDTATKWTGKLMAMPFGNWLVGAVALCIAGAGCYQGYKGLTASFKDELLTHSMSRKQINASVLLGRIGFVARMVVYFIIAGLLMKAALMEQARAAGGIGEALATLPTRTYGQWLLGLVATGLIAYGLFAALVLAPYRRITCTADDVKNAVN